MAGTAVQRRLAAILAADVVGYSKRMGEDEAGTLAAMRSIWADRFDPVVAGHRGRIVKRMGDGALVAFDSAVDAVECAHAIQQAMADRNRSHPDEAPIEFRIGVNLGDIIIDGEDIFGDGVNVAARLEGQAPTGGILVSDAVHAQVRGKVSVAFADAGELELKNIATPVRGWRWTGDAAPAPDGAKTADATGGRPSIAVLPFDNMSGDPDQEYFADGMVEEIITGLSRIRWLTVIARNSSFAFKGKATDIREVARLLDVRYVLEGSVRKAGNRVRITAQLIESETGGHLWADRFDGTLEDIFDLQDRITDTVVAVIEPSVRKAETERAKRKRPSDLGAYDLYLRALDQASRFSPEGQAAALDLLDAALRLDAGYAEAHGLAAVCLQRRFMWGGRQQPEDRAAALAHAEKVAASGSDDATTLSLAALAQSALGGDRDSAVLMVDRALAQTPSSALAHSVKAAIEMFRANPEVSLRHAEQSLRLSPFDPVRYLPETSIACVAVARGDHEAGLAHARRALDASPTFAPAIAMVALCQVRLGRMEEARAALDRLLEVAPETRVSNLRERFLSVNMLGFDAVAADLVKAGLPD